MDDALSRLLGTIFTVLGSSGILLMIGRAIWRWATGRSARERRDNASVETQRMQAVEERNQADAKERVVEDYAFRLRRQISDLGSTPLNWPDLDHTIPRAQLRRLRNSKSKE